VTGIRQASPMLRFQSGLAVVWFSAAQTCKDSHEQCAFWAESGECDENPGYMLTSCALSCGECCMDNNPLCGEWASQGECEANPAYMLEGCPKSCGLCKDPEEDPRCVDQSKDCLALTDEGQCMSDREMYLKCPQTCRLCGPDDECRANWERGAFEEDEMEQLFLRLDAGAFQEFGPRVVHRHPWIVVFDNFQTKPQADEVLSQFQSGWERSTAGGLIGQHSAQDVRTSETIWCNTPECEETPGMRYMLSMVENITGIDRANFEDTQVLKYMPGQKYGAHVDRIVEQNRLASGPRVMTMFVYLSDLPDGGTHFPRLNITLNATKGTAALWHNVDSKNIWNAEPLTEHEGLPPSGSPKYAANVWVHQYGFKTHNQNGCFLANRRLRFRDKSVQKPTEQEL